MGKFEGGTDVFPAGQLAGAPNQITLRNGRRSVRTTLRVLVHNLVQSYQQHPHRRTLHGLPDRGLSSYSQEKLAEKCIGLSNLGRRHGYPPDLVTSAKWKRPEFWGRWIIIRSLR